MLILDYKLLFLQKRLVFQEYIPWNCFGRFTYLILFFLKLLEFFFILWNTLKMKLKHGKMDGNIWNQNHIANDTVIRYTVFSINMSILLNSTYKMKKIIFLIVMLRSLIFFNCKLQTKWINKKKTKKCNYFL